MLVSPSGARICQSINGAEYQRKWSLLTIQTVLCSIELSAIECTFLLRFLLLIAYNRIESNGIYVSAVGFRFTSAVDRRLTAQTKPNLIWCSIGVTSHNKLYLHAFCKSNSSVIRFASVPERLTPEMCLCSDIFASLPTLPWLASVPPITAITTDERHLIFNNINTFWRTFKSQWHLNSWISLEANRKQIYLLIYQFGCDRSQLLASQMRFPIIANGFRSTNSILKWCDANRSRLMSTRNSNDSNHSDVTKY